MTDPCHEKTGTKGGDDALLLFLSAGLGVKAAAEKAGISARTAYRRLKDPAFRQQLAQSRAATLDRALGDMLEGAPEMVKVLRELAKTAEEETVRLGAARSFLEITTKLRQTVQLEERLAELEAEWRSHESQEPNRPLGQGNADGRQAL